MNERFESVDFDEFHTAVLPKKLAECAPLDLAGLRPIAFGLHDGRSYTYMPSRDGIVVLTGDEEASTVAVLAHRDWCDFVWELRTSFALLYADAVTFRRGGFGQLSRWEPVLRAVLDDQAIYDLAEPPPLVDLAGRALDLSRSFTLEDPDDAIRDFLERAGYVHLRRVFGDGEIEALRSEADRAVARARPDDRRSWWTTVDGEEVCHRVTYLSEQSPLIARLSDDSRLRRIGRLGGPDLRVAADRLDGHSLVVKVPGAASGLADLPWHRDCGMGGHPVKCPLLNIGIQLDSATAASGQLQMIAGSHRGSSPLPAGDEVDGPPVVGVDTLSGDVTVHWGHTLHAAPPPLDRAARGRRALYVTFVQPLTFEVVGPGQGYNDVLFRRDEGRVRHVGELH